MKPKCGELLTNFTYMYIINETQNCDGIKIVAFVILSDWPK